jgi:hypothetical protein
MVDSLAIANDTVRKPERLILTLLLLQHPEHTPVIADDANITVVSVVHIALPPAETRGRRPRPVRLLLRRRHERLVRLLPSAAMRAAIRAVGVFEDGSNAASSRLFDGQLSQLFENCISLPREEWEHRAEQPAGVMLGASRAYLCWTDDESWC